MDNRVFKLLKNDIASSGEINAVQRAVQRLTTALAQQLGAGGNVLVQVSEQLTHELGIERNGAPGEFLTYFGGKGPMAQRLADASIIDELLYGKHEPAKEHQVAKVLMSFNYLPSSEAALIHDVHHFCQHVAELLQVGNLEVAPYEPYPVMTLDNAKSGFYWQDDGQEGRAHSIVLATQIPGTDVLIRLFGGTYHPINVYAYHPQECTWVQYDGTGVLPGMLECLESELEAAYSDLNQAYRSRDWQAEFDQASLLAWDILARSDVLPMRLRSFVRISEVDRQICVIEAGYKAMFQSITGDYPNDSVTLLSCASSDGKIAFTVQLKDLPQMVQCRLVCVIKEELAHLLRSLTEAEKLAAQDANAP